MNKLNIRKVINASGKMSILGTSTVSDEVAEGINYGAKNFFVMEEYIDQLQVEIAKILEFPASKITASAASGIVVAVAASIGKNKKEYYQQPYNSNIPNEIVIPKGHNVNFGAPVESLISMGGGQVIESGFANECRREQVVQKISKETAALMYVVSHHSVQKNILSLKDMIEIAKEYRLPIIVDAAAEDNLTYYKDLDIDLLIFSGSKAIEGPNSGIILGNKEAIAWTENINDGIGRAMKVSKEAASGLYVALNSFVDSEDKKQFTKEFLSEKVESLNNFKGMNAYLSEDTAGRDIQRIAVESEVKIMEKIVSILEDGDPAIYTRNYLLNQGIIEIDLRSIDEESLEFVITRIGDVIYELTN